MICERIVDDEMVKAKSPSKFFKRYNAKNPKNGGYQKDRRFSGYTESKDNIKLIRQSWEDMVNAEYKTHGIDKVVIPQAVATGGAGAPWKALLVMMGLAFVLSLCSSSDAGVVRSMAGSLPAGGRRWRTPTAPVWPLPR